MSVEEYADLESRLGARLEKVNGVWWRRVRPFFYRPLIAYQAINPAVCRPPLQSLLGGYQHVVPSDCEANSTIGSLMFTEAQEYSLDSLDSDHRRQVRTALKRFEVRNLTDRQAFKERAYPLYLSFLKRTNYRYLAGRARKTIFERWADLLFDLPAILKLGVFAGNELSAVSVSFLVEDTVIYATFFARSEAMNYHVSSLMLHTVRQSAAVRGDVRQVFVGMCKTGKNRSVDQFYLQRGCSVQHLPARLKINPFAKLLLRTFKPGLLQQLVGSPPRDS